MSTEHQKYSTENQGEVIRRYAEQRGIALVRTYADHGKSGLRLDGRDALKRLIDDVRAGRTDFSAVLVYDVTGISATPSSSSAAPPMSGASLRMIMKPSPTTGASVGSPRFRNT